MPIKTKLNLFDKFEAVQGHKFQQRSSNNEHKFNGLIVKSMNSLCIGFSQNFMIYSIVSENGYNNYTRYFVTKRVIWNRDFSTVIRLTME